MVNDGIHNTLTGPIDSMVPANSPWALLAPICGQALPSMPDGQPPANPHEPATGWLPDSLCQLIPLTWGLLGREEAVLGIFQLCHQRQTWIGVLYWSPWDVPSQLVSCTWACCAYFLDPVCG
ncbi:hypothetical protein DSO57_1034279 [Entomophthora muscae]|uniref:Uncharacterized protein n=1 Tax=Entomophthora muscae TaxID=34485 RepID=A0ACC2TYC3_9FUNG|nr:hypothetical protein DSO57_1034279 [Entomophthora muscae]